MRSMLLTFLVILALVGASPAFADHPGQPLKDAATLKYIQFAYQFYKQPVGCSHAVLGLPTDRPYDPNGAGWADQPGCSIWVDPFFWPYEGREKQAQYCGLIMHEVGHNLGLGHTEGVPNSPMDTKLQWFHPGCWSPYHVLHRHRHIHKHRHRSGRIHRHRHYHRHYHLKVGQP